MRNIPIAGAKCLGNTTAKYRQVCNVITLGGVWIQVCSVPPALYTPVLDIVIRSGLRLPTCLTEFVCKNLQFELAP